MDAVRPIRDRQRSGRIDPDEVALNDVGGHRIRASRVLEIDPDNFLAKQGLARIRLAEKKTKVAKPSKVSKMAGIFSKK